MSVIAHGPTDERIPLERRPRRRRPVRCESRVLRAWARIERECIRARCEYGPAQSLGPIVNSPAFDGSPTTSADDTELFFTSERKGLLDLFVSTRPNREAAWTAPVNLGLPVDDPSAGDFSLRLSSDGNTLYFSSTRNGGFGKADIYAATRASRQHPWSAAANLGPRINTDAFEAFPTPTPDGTMLYFNRSTSFDSQDSDIWLTSRANPAGEWSEPQRAPAPINSDRAEFSPAFCRRRTDDVLRLGS